MDKPIFLYDQAVTAAIMESSLDATFTIRDDGVIVDANASATRFFGWSKEEFLGLNISCIVASPHKSQHDIYLNNFDPFRGVKHILGNGQLLMAERKDGSQFPVEVGISSFSIDGKRFFSGFVRDMTERQAHVDQLQRIATHDNDTGLLNYRDLLALAMQHGGLPGQACIYLQLSGFSRVVAAQGRPVGWQILRTVAERLLGYMNPSDSEPALARVGEFTFALFMNGNEMTFARECQATVNTPIRYAGVNLQAVSRIGISTLSGTVDERFREATTACEHVDDTGGGILPFSNALAERLQRETLIESRLRNAVADNALRLLLQPKINLGTGAIIGAEALVRWQDAELGFVSPADFIPIAERTGQILPITDWMLAQSLEAIRPFADIGLSVAVNFSSLDFRHSDVVQRVKAALSAADVTPTQLVVELTESSVTDDPVATAARMRELKALGIAISLDDFGTGYSSLSYLRQFPIDSLKIDASFVRHTPDSADANAITAAIEDAPVIRPFLSLRNTPKPSFRFWREIS